MHPLWFIPVAAALVILSKLPAAIAMGREGRGYDNKNPRQQQSRLSGWGQRGCAAHQNTIEAFPIFAACLLTGVFLHGDTTTLLACGSVFVAARIIYICLYVADLATLRSLVWGCGFFASLAAAVCGLTA